jgi:hypothetical protein
MSIEDEARRARELTEAEESWAFRTASYVFERNCKECLDYLWGVEHKPDDDQLALASDRSRQESVSQEVTRLLANTVGAAVALRHAIKGMHRRLHKDGSFPDFVERREMYDTDPIVQFVVRLRDYLVHVKPIAITFSFHVPDQDDPGGFRTEVGVDLGALRRDAKGWRSGPSTQAARRYLDDLSDRPAAEKPTVFMHLLQFRVDVQAFYQWFGQRETELQRQRLRLATADEP